jgi:class 3 adenylate cyclase
MSSTGTATRGFLFADLRGYSAYTEREGDEAARRLIGRFRELVRHEIDAHSGAEIRTEGDSFYVVFDSVAEAVLAGVDISNAAAAESTRAAGAPIRVGIGIHAGETRDGEEGIVSSAVNIAARVCSVAEPGEVLVTDTVRALTRTSVPVRFAPRGRRRLKGIAEPIQLYRVGDGAAATTDRSRGRMAGAVIGGLGMVGVAVIVTVVLQGRDPTTGSTASRTASPSTSVPSSPEETHDLGRFTDPGEFPNEDELALLDRLPPGATSSCARADPSTYPAHYFPISEDNDYVIVRPVGIRAGITCLTGGNTATYLQVATQASQDLNYADEVLGNLLLRRRIEEGSCRERSRAWEAWTSGAHSGRVMCFIREGEAVLEWSYIEPNIFAIATRRDGDRSALYEWWEDTGRWLSR